MSEFRKHKDAFEMPDSVDADQFCRCKDPSFNQDVHEPDIMFRVMI